MKKVVTPTNIEIEFDSKPSCRKGGVLADIKDFFINLFLFAILLVVAIVIVKIILTAQESNKKSACLKTPSSVERGATTPHNLDSEQIFKIIA